MSPRPSDAVASLLGQRIQAPTSAVERVADVLREQIVDGALRPGTQLTEESLSTAMRVSRNTVREAYSLLIGERIAVRIPNRGVFVAAPDVAAISDLYAVRALLEPAALRWGPGLDEMATAALRADVTEAQRCREARDWVGVASENQHFHRHVVAVGGSERLSTIFATVLAEMRLVFDEAGGPFHAPFVDQNAHIVELLERGQREDAAEELTRYLSDACTALISAVSNPPSRD